MCFPFILTLSPSHSYSLCPLDCVAQIDDFEQQSLKAALFNDDLGWNDTLLAAGELPFGKVEGEQQDDKGNIFDGFSLAEFIKVPMSG